KRDAELAKLRDENRILQELAGQRERELKRTEQAFERELARGTPKYISDPPSGAQKKEPSGQPKLLGFSRRVVVLLVVALAVIGLAGFAGYKYYRQSRFEDLTSKVYSTSLPGALRRGYLEELIRSYHQQAFDGIDFTNATLDGIN